VLLRAAPRCEAAELRAEVPPPLLKGELLLAAELRALVLPPLLPPGSFERRPPMPWLILPPMPPAAFALRVLPVLRVEDCWPPRPNLLGVRVLPLAAEALGVLLPPLLPPGSFERRPPIPWLILPPMPPAALLLRELPVLRGLLPVSRVLLSREPLPPAPKLLREPVSREPLLLRDPVSREPLLPAPKLPREPLSREALLLPPLPDPLSESRLPPTARVVPVERPKLPVDRVDAGESSSLSSRPP